MKLEVREFIDLLNEYQSKNPKELIMDLDYINENLTVKASEGFLDFFEDKYPEYDIEKSIVNYIEYKINLYKESIL